MTDDPYSYDRYFVVVRYHNGIKLYTPYWDPPWNDVTGTVSLMSLDTRCRGYAFEWEAWEACFEHSCMRDSNLTFDETFLAE